MRGAQRRSNLGGVNSPLGHHPGVMSVKKTSSHLFPKNGHNPLALPSTSVLISSYELQTTHISHHASESDVHTKMCPNAALWLTPYAWTFQYSGTNYRSCTGIICACFQRSENVQEKQKQKNERNKSLVGFPPDKRLLNSISRLC